VTEERFEIRRLDRTAKDGGFLNPLNSQILDEKNTFGFVVMMVSDDLSTTFHYIFPLPNLKKESDVNMAGIMKGKKSVNHPLS